ncbi:MAG: hypothetical protein AAGE52_42425 [Myxococcota bacterium]
MRFFLGLLLLGACGDSSGPPDAAEDAAPDAPPLDDSCLEAGNTLAIEGGVTDLAIDEGVLYVGSPTALRVLDLELTVEREVAVEAEQVLATDGRVAVRSGGEVRLLGDDLEVVGRVNASVRSTAAIREARLFVFRHPESARINTFEITNIAELTTPEVLGGLDVGGTVPGSMAVDNERAYAVDSSSPSDVQILVIDVANSAAPTLLQSLRMGGLTPASDVSVREGMLYVGTTDGVRIFQTTDFAEVGLHGGGPVVAVSNRRIATAGETLRVLRGGCASLEPAAELARTATSLAWSGSTLVVGTTEGVETFRWVCR